jgi:hypothetical protein
MYMSLITHFFNVSLQIHRTFLLNVFCFAFHTLEPIRPRTLNTHTHKHTKNLEWPYYEYIEVKINDVQSKGWFIGSPGIPPPSPCRYQFTNVSKTSEFALKMSLY